jgi:hypothetical protein
MRKRSVIPAMGGVMAGGRTVGGNEGQDRLPRRQGRDRATKASGLRGQGAGPAELGGGGCRRLAWQVGYEPDADQRFARSVRLPEGDVPAPTGAGLTKSTVFRRFVALSAARMKEWSRRRSRTEWLVLKSGAHEGYVDWERAEAIRRMVSFGPDSPLKTPRVARNSSGGADDPITLGPDTISP